MPTPSWQFYFNVASVEAAAAKVKAGGGKVTHAPSEVPGGQWIMQATDPQGGHFAVSGAK
jgi:hypothetical protein